MSTRFSLTLFFLIVESFWSRFCLRSRKAFLRWACREALQRPCWENKGWNEGCTVNGREIQVRRGGAVPFQQRGLQVAFAEGATALCGPMRTPGSQQSLPCSTPKPEAGNRFGQYHLLLKLSFLLGSREGRKNLGNSQLSTWIYLKEKLDKRGSLYNPKMQISLST